MAAGKYKYVCEICKKAPKHKGFRRNYRWKTERGFKNHHCYSEVLKRQEEQAIQKAKKEKEEKKKLKERIDSGKYKIGEKIYYHNYRVTKPTHVWRGTRWVKVRYEEKRHYYASQGKIQKITLNGVIVNGEHIYDSNICSTLEEAESIAKKAQSKYEEHCNFSAMCR